MHHIACAVIFLSWCTLFLFLFFVWNFIVILFYSVYDREARIFFAAIVKCRADLNFEVDFGVNSAIGAIVTKWDLILFG